MHQKTRRAPFAYGLVAKVSEKTGTFSVVAVDGADVAPVNVGAAAVSGRGQRAARTRESSESSSKLASSGALF